MNGIAFCHSKENIPLSKRFKDLPEDIKWIYVDINADEDEDTMKGSIYDYRTIEKLSSFRKDGYDYIVMPNCPVKNNNLYLYNLYSPIISCSCLLKREGKLLNNNSYSCFVNLLDPILSGYCQSK